MNTVDTALNGYIYVNGAWYTLPPNLAVVRGDITESPATYITHQTNCVATYPHGLSNTVFAAFPYANVYEERRLSGITGVPGTVAIRGDGVGRRYVANTFAQRCTGRPEYPDDTAAMRNGWFRECLAALAAAVTAGESAAFPWAIGCGLARGNWDAYFPYIAGFAVAVGAKGCRAYFVSFGLGNAGMVYPTRW